jgi:ABC-type branched-subunit amino acid transport system ATPase component
MDFILEAGKAIIFVGANGSGKTRLAVNIESSLALKAHRISAHRSLNLNPSVAKISQKKALMGLRTGHPDESARLGNRTGSRWHGKEATAMLNDFDFLIQSLFAEMNNTTHLIYERAKPERAPTNEPFQYTKFDRLVEIWENVLPHRRLEVTGDDIKVTVLDPQVTYSASDMSDGERAIFYIIGQALMAEPETVLIVDEPELHVHRSIMSKLWDEVAAERSDCGLIFITHDLEFAASRPGQKFVIREYLPVPQWTLEEVPEETGFDEEILTLILGSRRPILFVEGKHSSLDSAFYRSCFPNWTIIPRSSCEEVIYAVSTLRANANLTRIRCSGIVDADGRTANQIERLSELGIQTLKVSEIENLVLLPDVSRAIAQHESYSGATLEALLGGMESEIFAATKDSARLEGVVARHCRRRIDAILKSFDFSGSRTVVEIDASLKERVSSLNILDIASKYQAEILNAIEMRNLPKLLSIYEDKGLFAIASRHLKSTGVKEFKGWLARILINDQAPLVKAEILKNLPNLE